MCDEELYAKSVGNRGKISFFRILLKFGDLRIIPVVSYFIPYNKVVVRGYFVALQMYIPKVQNTCF